jgi:hypothetical protein
MKGFRENFLLLLTALLFSACAPALTTGQATDIIVGSSSSLDESGHGAQPTDGTVGSQVEPVEMNCQVLAQFCFPGEPQTLWIPPVIKMKPLNDTWDDVGNLYWRDEEDAETILPPCEACVGSVLRIISLGKFSDEALNQEGAARMWFNKLLSHETLDEVYGSEVFYQDFEITDPTGFSLQDFPFEIDGHYLFLLIEDSPNAFVGRGDKSLSPEDFKNEREFAGNLEMNDCISKGQIRSMRLIQARFIFSTFQPIF